jgi:hypothetical protein
VSFLRHEYKLLESIYTERRCETPIQLSSEAIDSEGHVLTGSTLSREGPIRALPQEVVLIVSGGQGNLRSRIESADFSETKLATSAYF